MVQLTHCAELVITGINYADCDGTFTLNDTCTSQSACEMGKQPLHWSKGTAANGRQMWWCGKSEDDPAGKYTCTPWTTGSCGGSFGSTDKPGAGYSCASCATGWGGEGCNESITGSGGILVIAAALCLMVYLGGGVAVGVRKNGARPGLAAHPHRTRWAELAGLCRDGMRFTQERLRGSSHVGGLRIGATEPLVAPVRAEQNGHRKGKSKGKSKDKDKSYSKSETRHLTEVKSQNITSSPTSDSDIVAPNDGKTEQRKAKVSEQHIVAENLHQSQAKIAVVGLNEM